VAEFSLRRVVKYLQVSTQTRDEAIPCSIFQANQSELGLSRDVTSQGYSDKYSLSDAEVVPRTLKDFCTL
jgi:hypothetical protein